MGSAEFQTNDATIIQTIKDSVAIERFEPKVGEVFSHKLYFPPEKDLVPKLEISSLTGIVDYIKKGVDDSARKSASFIHVVSPTEVRVVNEVLDREERRWSPVVAKFEPNTSDLLHEEFVSQADAIIDLQSCFVATERRGELIKILGTISREDGVNQEDDGATQSVTLRSGVKAGEAKIENPYELKPYRTFPEIDQPESPFIVRLDNSLRIGLFCADGNAWKNAARVAIKEFLEKEINDGESAPKIPILA